jgi:O-antigen/teichoic acid export membrane protein
MNYKQIFQNKILKLGSMSLMATVLTRAINLISVPIFSRLLTTAEYGQVDVFMTYVNIFFVILGLDFHGTVGKGRLDHEGAEDQYIASSILFTTLSAVLVAAIINIFFAFLHGIFGLERWSVNLMLVYSYAMFIMNYRSAEYNFNFEYKKNMQMSVTVAVLNLALSVVFIETIFRDAHLLGRILGATIPTVCCAAYIYWFYGTRGNWSFKKEHIVYSLKFGVPLIPHNLSHLVISNADRVMINSMISSSAAGIYSLSYTLGLLMQVVSEAMNQVFSPWEFRKFQKSEGQDVRIAQRPYLLLYVMITFAVMAVSPEIVKIIGAEEYWDGISIILWIVFATFLNFTYTLYVNVEFFYRKTGLISVGTVLAALTNIGLNVLFLEQYGYHFAAMSTVISYAALLFFHMIILNFVLKKNVVDNMFVILVVAFVFIVTLILNQFLSSLEIRILVGLLADIITALLWYINTEESFNCRSHLMPVICREIWGDGNGQ